MSARMTKRKPCDIAIFKTGNTWNRTEKYKQRRTTTTFKNIQSRYNIRMREMFGRYLIINF